MTKTLIIRSRREYQLDTPKQAIEGAYTYYVASHAVQLLIKAATIYNKTIKPKQLIMPNVKYTEQEKAKVKLKGDKLHIECIINCFLADANIAKYYDVIIK